MSKVIVIVIESYLYDLVLYVTSNNTNVLRFNKEIKEVFKNISLIPVYSADLTGTIVILLNESNEVEKVHCYGSNILKGYVENSLTDIKKKINQIFKGEVNEETLNNNN